MLRIDVPEATFWNEETEEFIDMRATTLLLEHSLISLSRWESKWQKPFLDDVEKTDEETLDYIRCMSLSQNVDIRAISVLTPEQLGEIQDYIASPMTATIVYRNKNGPKDRRKVTAERIYYWMIAYNIPFECEKWHLNRLLTLIDVCDIENSPKKKRPSKDILKENAELNKKRRMMLNTKG